MTLRVLDLFCGLGGATTAFEERGHDVVGVDLEDAFDPDIASNLFEVKISDLVEASPAPDEERPYDFIWASPPCTTFTVMAISTNWQPDGGPYPGVTESASGRHHRPKRGQCYRNIALLEWTLEVIRQLDPRAWILENPRGMARNIAALDERHERRTVTYCQYGMPYMKPTDLWGGAPAPA